MRGSGVALAPRPRSSCVPPPWRSGDSTTRLMPVAAYLEAPAGDRRISLVGIPAETIPSRTLHRIHPAAVAAEVGVGVSNPFARSGGDRDPTFSGCLQSAG